MASASLQDWNSRISQRLDELEDLHQRATGTARGRRWGTDQFNGQLYVALVGCFQEFARSLHDEALDWLRTSGNVALVLANNAAINRGLDSGNPHVANLDRDFSKIGLQVTQELKGRPLSQTRLERLFRAIQLRNGIAHGDQSQLLIAASTQPPGRPAVPTMSSYRTHRSALNGLARDLDGTVATHLGSLLGVPVPW